MPELSGLSGKRSLPDGVGEVSTDSRRTHVNRCSSVGNGTDWASGRSVRMMCEKTRPDQSKTDEHQPHTAGSSQATEHLQTLT